MSTKFEHTLQKALSGTDLEKQLELRGTLGGVELRPKPNKSIAISLLLFALMPAVMMALFGARFASEWTGVTLGLLGAGALLGPVLALITWRSVLPQVTSLGVFAPLHTDAGLTLAIDEGRRVASSELSLVVRKQAGQHGEHYVTAWLAGEEGEHFRLINLPTVKPERELDALAELADLIGVTLREPGRRQGWWVLTMGTVVSLVVLLATPTLLGDVVHRLLPSTLGAASFALVVAVLGDALRLMPSRLSNAVPLARQYWSDASEARSPTPTGALEQPNFDVTENDAEVRLAASDRSVGKWNILAAATALLVMVFIFGFGLTMRLWEPSLAMLTVGALFLAQWLFIATKDARVGSLTTKKRVTFKGPTYRNGDHDPAPLELDAEPLRVVHLLPKVGRTGELWAARGGSIQRIAETKLSGDHDADVSRLDAMVSRLDPRITSKTSSILVTGPLGLLIVGFLLAIGPSIGLLLIAKAELLTGKVFFGALLCSLFGVLFIWLNTVSVRHQVKNAFEDLEGELSKPKARHRAGAAQPARSSSMPLPIAD